MYAASATLTFGSAAAASYTLVSSLSEAPCSIPESSELVLIRCVGRVGEGDDDLDDVAEFLEVLDVLEGVLDALDSDPLLGKCSTMPVGSSEIGVCGPEVVSAEMG